MPKHRETNLPKIDQTKIRLKGSKMIFSKIKKNGFLKSRFLTVNFGFSMNLIAKTASPGPGVSVPTQGS